MADTLMGSAGRRSLSRRRFLQATGTLAAAGMAYPALGRIGHVAGSDRLRIGVIGCGGRGTGAAADALRADESADVVAMADVFEDRLRGSLGALRGEEDIGERVSVTEDRCYWGFDSYKRLLESGVDVVVLATNPHFRPMHFEAAVQAGCHVFMEKPTGVDPAGVRRVLAAGEIASKKGLRVVAGTQRRHEAKYVELMKRVHDGAIGRIVSGRCWWNQGSLWVRHREPGWSDMEWQLRNWLYFCWLSGDHIVEQHVHNLDVLNWAIGSTPTRAVGMGGRQVRVQPEYGNIFDHFAVEYEYADGISTTSMCRQIDGCENRVDEEIVGTEGVCRFGAGVIEGKRPYKYEDRDAPSPYVQEHRDLFAAIRRGDSLNEARNVATSTLTAIMGRMSAYTGKAVSWDFAMTSKLDLTPPSYEMGPVPTAPVPTPGKTPLE